MNITTVSIQIMGREFKIQCPENNVKDLEESAECISKKIRDMGIDGQVLHREDALVIMALNIARELLDYKNKEVKEQSYLSLIGQNLRELKTKIEQELTAQV